MQVRPTHRNTPLFEIHKALGARLIEFAGFQMPVEYEGIVKEALAVRRGCGLFDVSHMGQIQLTGPRALEFLQLVTTNNVACLRDGLCQYTLICNDHGGIVDDVILYRLSSERFLLCVNAVNREKVLAWLADRAPSSVMVEDVSEGYALIALQGRRVQDVLTPVSTPEPSSIRRFHFSCGRVAGREAIISRTGYTGEDGFEFYIAPSDAEAVWDALMEEGRRYNIKPCGLGARDVLRIEAGLPLYGNELTEETSPIEAGLSRFVHMDKEFTGKRAIEKHLEEGIPRILTGFEMEKKAIPRKDYPIKKDDSVIGRVTSGTWSALCERAIGMGYVDRAFATPGATVEIETRGRLYRAFIRRLPFYRPSQKTT